MDPTLEDTGVVFLLISFLHVWLFFIVGWISCMKYYRSNWSFCMILSFFDSIHLCFSEAIRMGTVPFITNTDWDFLKLDFKFRVFYFRLLLTLEHSPFGVPNESLFCFPELLFLGALLGTSLCHALWVHWDCWNSVQLLSCLAIAFCLVSWILNHIFGISKRLQEKKSSKFGWISPHRLLFWDFVSSDACFLGLWCLQTVFNPDFLIFLRRMLGLKRMVYH